MMGKEGGTSMSFFTTERGKMEGGGEGVGAGRGAGGGGGEPWVAEEITAGVELTKVTASSSGSVEESFTGGLCDGSAS